MRKILLQAGVALAMLLSTSACNQQAEITPTSEPGKLTDAIREELMHDFSSTLSKALQNEPALRQFLKTESAKQFDGDYDILYQLARQTRITGNQTFEQVLAKYTAEPSRMDFINRNFLNLNIKVLGFDTPVEQWKTDEFIPLVVVRPYNEKVKTFTAYTIDDLGKSKTIQVDT